MECKLLEGGGGPTRNMDCIVNKEWVGKLRLGEK